MSTDIETIVQTDEEIKQGQDEPPLYKVIMLNDDYTPMEFVSDLLRTVFHMDEKKAIEITLQIHYQGKGICGVFPLGIAETKVVAVVNSARKNGYPLICQTERV